MDDAELADKLAAVGRLERFVTSGEFFELGREAQRDAILALLGHYRTALARVSEGDRLLREGALAAEREMDAIERFAELNGLVPQRRRPS